MDYNEIIYRASLAAHRYQPDVPIDRYQATAETIFPSIPEALALSVANDINHPWRPYLQGVTNNMASGDPVSQLDSVGRPIIGVYGTVRDADDNLPLEGNFSLSVINSLRANVNGWRTQEVYGYVIILPNIYHTRDSAYIEVCCLGEDQIATAIAANEVPLFPDAQGYYVEQLTAKLTGGKTTQ